MTHATSALDALKIQTKKKGCPSETRVRRMRSQISFSEVSVSRMGQDYTERSRRLLYPSRKKFSSRRIL